MNELMFRKWLVNNGYNNKVVSDTVSRLKKLEHSVNNCDIDSEFKKDNCAYLLSLFFNKGENENMAQLTDNELPVGKYHLSTYKYALNIYIKFKQEEKQNG